jgi:predicted regulator of amino acid metabolism with ACT domain
MMWDKVVKNLGKYPERLAVAKILIKNGLSIIEGTIYCDNIKISLNGISRAAKVDRRTVTKTINMIESDPELSLIFNSIKPSGLSLRNVARYLNLGVIEITPVDAKRPGILAAASSLIAAKKISIRQAIVDDPELTPEPKLILIAEKKIPGELINDLLKTKGILKISVY